MSYIRFKKVWYTKVIIFYTDLAAGEILRNLWVFRLIPHLKMNTQTN